MSKMANEIEKAEISAKMGEKAKEFNELKEKLNKITTAEIKEKELPLKGIYICAETEEVKQEIDEKDPSAPPKEIKTGKILNRTYGHVLDVLNEGLLVERVFEDYTNDTFGVMTSRLSFGSIADSVSRRDKKEYDEIKRKIIGKLGKHDEPEAKDHKGH
jgi:hypothetical protein